MARGTRGAGQRDHDIVTATTASGATTAEEIRDQVRDASARRRRLRIVGSGSWLDANRPVHADATLVTQNARGIVEYEPGDLTLTARAGTTLDEIARATAEHGQWLALDPPGDRARATLGATLATGSYGPLAYHFGTPRDMTLGIEMVTGTAEIVRGGGRVVKNVAGFDLTRLAIGSWGTLGVLTEATVRLRAIPRKQITLAVEVSSTPEAVASVRARLRALPFVPLAATLVRGPTSGAIDVDVGDTALLVRLGGNEQAVEAQRDQLRAVGNLRDIDDRVWEQLRTREPAIAAVVRLSRLPSLIGRTWHDATRIASPWPGGYCEADVGRGVARVVLPLDAGSTPVELRSRLDVPFDGTRIYERLPESLWPQLAPAADHGELERRVKSAFDPHNVLNPGIFGESP